MEIYLDANATTPVLPAAQAAALACMGERFGNPSSTHATGLRARAVLDETRARARRLLGAPTGQLLFTSGATEGIQTAVLSALSSLRGRDDVDCLLYGATEHKAVPAALHHWNRLLDLGLVVAPIPVDLQGRHDLDWLRRHAGRAGLVCTMAANNESGVISDLDGIEAALADSPALWLVDGVQGLGKLDLRLAERRIDYAPFSGHKLYAPKGIGLLYVREGAPFTPLMAGGGQEGGLRSGTENMAGVAALGAVLAALEDGHTFAPAATLARHRERLAAALSEAFPGLVFNAPAALSLPTTLNFSVPGVTSRLLLELFDAAGVRLSGGSACSAAQAAPSFVLEAMGLPAWQTGSAIRLSFGPLADEAFIDAACARIRACGEALRAQGLPGKRPPDATAHPVCAPAGEPEPDLLCSVADVAALAHRHPGLTLVDVREAHELGWDDGRLDRLGLPRRHLPLSQWLDTPPGQGIRAVGGGRPDTPLLFICRSGQRSAQAARRLRQQGHALAWSLTGGVALLPEAAAGADGRALPA